MFGWLYDLLHRLELRRERMTGTVDCDPRGFVLRRGREIKAMRWDEVCRIEVGRQPTPGVEIFFAVLWSDREGILVDDVNSGFQAFQDAVLARWPAVEAEWTRVFMGSPDKAEQVEVWKR